MRFIPQRQLSSQCLVLGRNLFFLLREIFVLVILVLLLLGNAALFF